MCALRQGLERPSVTSSRWVLEFSNQGKLLRLCEIKSKLITILPIPAPQNTHQNILMCILIEEKDDKFYLDFDFH